MAKLPKRQQKVLTFIQKYIAENGFPPTVREIGEGAGVSSTSLVTYYLKKLEEKGYIAREPSVSRGIRLLVEAESLNVTALPGTDENVDLISVPFLGYIVASEPIPVEALPGTETIEISQALFGRSADDLFALQVRGNSMIDALINDGDIVIFRHQDRVENGEMAAVWINGDAGETTLKKVYYEGKRVRLQPAHPTMEAFYIPASQLQVQGKVLMVIRRME